MEQDKAMRLHRQDIPVEQTWRLEDIYNTIEAWEADLQELRNDVTSITKFKGRLNEGASVLLECLSAQEEFSKKVIKVSSYANLRFSEDSTNPENQANAAKASGVLAELEASLSFVDSEILELPDGRIEEYLEQEPGLEPFRRVLLDLLEKKPYRLSPETEKALAALSEIHGAPYMTYQRTKLSDMQFEPFKDSKGNELPVSFSLFEEQYEMDPDPNVRRAAYQSFTKGLKQYQNTLGATFATEVKKHVVLAKLRGYESATHMFLHSQDVTPKMYHTLLDVIQKELAPHMRKYARLKKRVLGLDKMMFCDLKAPLDPEFEQKVTYDEATELVLESLKILGDEYNEFMKKALTERWVDRADNIGKATGAFCSGTYGVHPFILMTWSDSMRAIFTLVHELGHAGHFCLAGRYQRLANLWPSNYCGEAPSTMNELLLGKYILEKSTDPRVKRSVILEFLGTYYHNFVTHLLEGELQRRIYELAEKGVPINASVLSEQKGNILSEFWGDTVEIDDGAKLTWMRQPHYYLGLYSYTYSAGLTAATVCRQKFDEEGQPAVERWLEMLKAGGTLKPLELFKLAGVDMSTAEPIRQAVAYVGQLIDELETYF